ncbi:MAG: glycosyltransferase [Phycisphaerales bacterium]
MSALRIMHLAGTLDPAAGGPPVVAARLAAAQASLGNTVKIAAYRGDAAGMERAEGLLKETPNGHLVDVVWMPEPSRVERLTGRAAAKQLGAEFDAGTDVLHCHGMWEPVLPATAAQAMQRGIPFVVMPHGMLDPYTLSISKRKKQLAMATTHRAYVRKPMLYHMLNADEAELARPIIGEQDVRVIPNGIFLDEVDAAPPVGEFRKERPELGQSPYVLFLGRLTHKKGLDILAPAFAKVAASMADVRLVVAGPDDGMRAPFEAEVRAAGIADRVHVVGPIYGASKYAAMRDAAVFCLPSRQEGFSIAITEALALGVPVVVTRACHFPEVSEVGAGIETELDADDVADALRRVLGDSGRASEMGDAGATLVRERFTWPEVARQTLEAYKDGLMRVAP